MDAGDGYALLFSWLTGLLVLPALIIGSIILEVGSLILFVYPSYRLIKNTFANPTDNSVTFTSNTLEENSKRLESRTKSYIIVILITLLVLGLAVFSLPMEFQTLQGPLIFFVILFCAYWMLFISLVDKRRNFMFKLLKVISFVADAASFVLFFVMIMISSFLNNTLELNMDSSVVISSYIVVGLWIVGLLLCKRSLLKKIKAMLLQEATSRPN